MKWCKLFSIVLFGLIISIPCCYGKSKHTIPSGQGYVGTLPDLSRYYESKDKNDIPDITARPAKDFNSTNEIKPVPEDNPTFVNIILKTDKTSKYANDINEFIPILESLYDLIDGGSDVQIFNAKVFYFNKNVNYFRDKYATQPESQYISYKRLLELSAHAQSIATLRAEAEKYSPYLAYGASGYIYNPNMVNEQLSYLKDEIEQTILILRESN